MKEAVFLWALFALTLFAGLPDLAFADYQSRCSGCHGPSPNIANEVNNLPNSVVESVDHRHARPPRVAVVPTPAIKASLCAIFPSCAPCQAIDSAG